MIKPIIYHSFEEKELLERQLLAGVSKKKRLADAKALMDVFYATREVPLKDRKKSKKQHAK
jgi:hypothetical protein